MPSETDTLYDTVLYPGHAHADTHPDRLATTAAFYGMDPAPPARCRVLEIGCSFGGNLIPMAYQYPESQFIGIDLSRRAIERGMNTVASLGLKNIELQHRDIMDVTPEYGRFDYIISHGVYSWVPPVREKMLAIFSENLAPQGVAYVSYNAHPGSHLRDLSREMMLFHVRDMTDPQKRIEQGRAILTFLADASPEDRVHGAVMRHELKRVQETEEEVLFHDDLDEHSRAFLLHQVVADAGRHHLQYLSDAQLWRGDIQRYPEPVRNVLKMFSDRDFMERDQYQDFIDGHAFRRTLLCHGDIRLERALDASSIKRFHFASPAGRSSGEVDPGDRNVIEFKMFGDHTLTIDHPLSEAAFAHLGKSWPAAVGFTDLLAGAERLVAAANPAQQHASDKDVRVLTDILFRLACSGHIMIHLHPLPVTTTISERPQVSLFARKQAESQSPLTNQSHLLLTNLRHRMTLIEGDIGREFLMLVDGTRDIDQLVTDLSETLIRIGHEEGLPVTRANVEHHLQLLAGLGLLIG